MKSSAADNWKIELEDVNHAVSYVTPISFPQSPNAGASSPESAGRTFYRRKKPLLIRRQPWELLRASGSDVHAKKANSRTTDDQNMTTFSSLRQSVSLMYMDDTWRHVENKPTRQLVENMRENFADIQNFEAREEARKRKAMDRSLIYSASPRPSLLSYGEFDYSSDGGASHITLDTMRTDVTVVGPLFPFHSRTTQGRGPTIDLQLSFEEYNIERDVRRTIRQYRPNRSQDALARRMKRAAQKRKEHVDNMVMKSASARNSEVSDNGESSSDSSEADTTKAFVRTALTDPGSPVNDNRRRNLHRMDSMASTMFNTLVKYALEQVNQEDDDQQQTDTARMFDEEQHYELLKEKEEKDRLEQITKMMPSDDTMANFKKLKNITDCPDNVTESLIINRPKKAGFCQTPADEIIALHRKSTDYFFLGNGKKVFVSRDKDNVGTQSPELSNKRSRSAEVERTEHALELKKIQRVSLSKSADLDELGCILLQRPRYTSEHALTCGHGQELQSVHPRSMEQNIYQERVMQTRRDGVQNQESQHIRSDFSRNVQRYPTRPSTAPVVINKNALKSLSDTKNNVKRSVQRDPLSPDELKTRSSLCRLTSSTTFHELRKNLKSVADFPHRVSLSKRPPSEQLAAARIAQSVQNWVFVNDFRERGKTIVERAKNNLTREYLREEHTKNQGRQRRESEAKIGPASIRSPRPSTAPSISDYMRTFSIPFIRDSGVNRRKKT